MTTDHKTNKPYAGLSLDLDNEWSYLKAHGDPIWRNFPTYLPVVVPRILSLLAEFDIKITFFIVGKDAEFENNHGALCSIVKAGNDVGNHSQNHEPWMRENASEYEIGQAEELLEKVTGVHPKGFRGPGYSMSNQTLKVLAQRGYMYDSSTLPSFMGPLARAYYFMNTSLSTKQKEERGTLFGTFRDGLRPLKPYLWQIGDSTLTEIPVTTFPLFRVPFHFSYVLYLSTYSPILARTYWRSALRACRLAGIEPTLLLHSLDFLGNEDISTLSFFPGMNMRSEVKLGRIRNYLADLLADHTVISLNHYAEILQSRLKLKIKFPDFRTP
jgi:peptidoglycan/xylan/chitin deacetylase (PgdA/CDA1 family)